MKLIYSVIGGVAVLTGGYLIYRNHHQKTGKLDKAV